MSTRTFKSNKLFYLFISLIFYFFKKQLPPQSPLNTYKFKNASSMEDIIPNTLVILNNSLNIQHINIIKKCIKHCNVVLMNSNQYELITKCNFAKISGLFFYKGNNEFYDLETKEIFRTRNKVSLIDIVDLYVFYNVLILKKWLKEIGMSKILPTIFEVAFKKSFIIISCF